MNILPNHSLDLNQANQKAPGQPRRLAVYPSGGQPPSFHPSSVQRSSFKSPSAQPSQDQRQYNFCFDYSDP